MDTEGELSGMCVCACSEKIISRTSRDEMDRSEERERSKCGLMAFSILLRLPQPPSE